MDWRALMEGMAPLGWLRVDLLLRLLLAAILGGLVGLEREISGKPAGLRTNLLICVGAALLTELSLAIGLRTAERPNADPARIAAQIVSGIGFLGAGTIIQARGSVVGLTTAATLWVVAAIGMAVGAAAYVEAIGTTVLVIVVLVLLRRAEVGLESRRRQVRVRVAMAADPGRLGRIEAVLAGSGFSIDAVDVERTPDGFAASFELTGPRQREREVLAALLELPGVARVSRE
ncbi:MAG TPA: MgtC/SapB family protein [Longimicrobiales bacterium]